MCVSGVCVCVSIYRQGCEMERNGEVQEQMERPEALTDGERATIQNTWAKVYENKEAAGVAVLMRLFTSFPSAKQFFSQFRHIDDPEEMQASTQLRKHALRVMSALNTLVENVHDGEKTAEVLKVVAKSHAVKHNVEPGYFKILAGVILEVLVEAFPETFGTEAQGAWSKLMAVVYWHVTQVYAEIGWGSINNTAE
ncbi:cytoglobin-2-like [Pygocentrus nattereri]|uniref:superoxide dismutase n=1 Tax=Pygocentrus nattereri TaxID=42514 RepID=A0AAR2LGD9_PYGNA|nr:cytoglobin-2-like [Pygocentrus nattereri]